jgi:hypothetical protein
MENSEIGESGFNNSITYNLTHQCIEIIINPNFQFSSLKYLVRSMEILARAEARVLTEKARASSAHEGVRLALNEPKARAQSSSWLGSWITIRGKEERR